MGGGKWERELVNTLGECGFAAMRAPASGAATARDLPDILALRRADRYDEPLAEAFAVELKATAKNVAYVEPHEVAALERFADRAGAVPLLGARFKRNGYDRLIYLVRPEDAGRTQGEHGNYSVHVDEADDAAAVVVDATNSEVRFA